MDLLLDPGGPQVSQLRKLYLKAFREAAQLYIASAYLTEWDRGHRPNTGCPRDRVHRRHRLRT